MLFLGLYKRLYVCLAQTTQLSILAGWLSLTKPLFKSSFSPLGMAVRSPTKTFKEAGAFFWVRVGVRLQLKCIFPQTVTKSVLFHSNWATLWGCSFDTHADKHCASDTNQGHREAVTNCVHITGGSLIQNVYMICKNSHYSYVKPAITTAADISLHTTAEFQSVLVFGDSFSWIPQILKGHFSAFHQLQDVFGTFRMWKQWFM